MNVLKRCCMRSLKENRKRTMVTIVGVILATALITGVACLAESMRESLIARARADGDYHYYFEGVHQDDLKYFGNNVNVERIGLAYGLGYATLEGSANPDKPYLYLRAVDEEGIRSMALKLTEGRMPETDDELVIGRHIRYNGMVNLQVGDTLTLQLGERMSDGFSLDQRKPYRYEEEHLEPTQEKTQEKTYTIVGVVERPSVAEENRMAPGYSVFTFMDEATEAITDDSGRFEVFATYTTHGLKHADQVTAGLLGVPEELYQQYLHGKWWEIEEKEFDLIKEKLSLVSENSALVRWQLMKFSDSTMTMLYGMAALAVAVIIVTSVFCIRNSFVISLTEKMKLYGRLASVGTTAKQQRRMVYYEAVFIGAIGIPLGIVSGLLASVILVRGISGLLDTAFGMPMVFGVSVPAILLAAVLSAVTILLSALQSARRAARIAPLSAIRANDSVRIHRQELKCPGIVNKVFGIGGKVAYRNLRRARRRYRTTVISIVVSVAVFIGLSTFMELLQMASGMYYETRPYQLRVDLSGDDNYEMAVKITQLEDVQAADIYRMVYMKTNFDQLPLTEDFCQVFGAEQGKLGYLTVPVCSMGEEGFARYCKSVGVDVQEAMDKAIIYADYRRVDYVDNKRYVYEGKISNFRKGDTISVVENHQEDGGTENISEETKLQVIVQADVKPMSMADINYNNVVVIVSDAMFDELLGTFAEEKHLNSVVCIQCQDAGKVEEIVRMMQPTHFTITNFQAGYQEERSTYLLISILLYGFITVVALIGITNIFNTITTNLELRAPEFAMLRAVGMTGKEFRRMIWLEGLFYGGKALLIGIPIGIVISMGFHLFFSTGIVIAYQPPILGIALSIAAVALLLYVIMHYSMGKINRKNIVETIQNENL